MPTEMIYSTSLRQINYIASWFKVYMSKDNKNDFEEKLSKYMSEFISELERLNLLNEGLMKNDKFRTISLFGTNLDKNKDYFLIFMKLRIKHLLLTLRKHKDIELLIIKCKSLRTRNILYRL
jgi:hypothetical protein